MWTMFWPILACTCVIVFFVYRFLSNVWIVSDLSNKHVLVTGCDTGFGHLLALRLVNHGIPTFAGCLTEKGETELRKAAASAPGKLWTFRLDVTKQDSVDAAFAFVKSKLGPGKGLWGLVNNAGILSQVGPDDWLPLDAYEKAIDVNCFGVIRVSHTFKPLVKREKGRIVIITSIFGRVSIGAFAPYCASKFAAEAYCDCLRMEMKCFDVSVHILEPGLHVTNITNSKTIVAGLLELWKRQPEHIKEEFGSDFAEKSSIAIAKEFDGVTSDASHVVDAYFHALTSRLPKFRYVVGMDAQFAYLPVSLLPTWIGDFAFWMAMKIRNVPVPKACLKG